MNRKQAIATVLAVLSLSILGVGLWYFYFSRAYHDIEVLNVKPPARIYINYLNVVAVSVRNNGDEAESFNVTLYYNDTVIEVKTVKNLAPSSIVNLTFNWDTTGLSPTYYVLKAEADVVSGETKVENNIFQTSALQLVVKPTISLNPSAKTIHINETFTLAVTVSNVVDLYGWEFKLGWNASLLEVVSVEEGGFLKSGDETFFSEKTNNTAGYVHLACTLLGDVSGVNGSGILAIIEFRVKAPGECALDLYDTALGDSNLQSIPHVTNDGYCYFVEETVESGGGRGRPPMPT